MFVYKIKILYFGLGLGLGFSNLLLNTFLRLLLTRLFKLPASLGSLFKSFVVQSFAGRQSQDSEASSQVCGQDLAYGIFGKADFSANAALSGENTLEHD